MLTVAFRLLGRIGLLGAILMALGVGLMTSPAMAFAGDDTVSVSASAEIPCETDDCNDCGPACAHGCCHASLVVLAQTPAVLAAPFAYSIAPGWTQRGLAPLAAPSGPERPPRA